MRTGMSKHAVLSPSSAHRWLRCAGSVVLSEGLENTSSEAADEGTAAHELAARCLQNNTHPAQYIGEIIQAKERQFEVTSDMAGNVNVYVQHIREYALGNILYVEERFPIDHMTGEKDAEGTSDAVIVVPKDFEVQIHDAKFGYDKVYAKENEQELMYASSVIRALELVYEIKHIRLVIHQPRINWLDEWDCSIEYLREFEERVRKQSSKIFRIKSFDMLVPGEKQCKYCRAFPCAAADKQITEAIEAEFEVIAQNDTPIGVSNAPDVLAIKKAAVPLIRKWCDTVDKKVAEHLHNGVAIPGWKLVQGTLSDRKWGDEEKALAVLKEKNITDDIIYTKKMISYPQAEKLFKKKPTKKDPSTNPVWDELSPLMAERKPGPPSVAPEDDPRTPYNPNAVIDEFEMITEDEESLL